VGEKKRTESTDVKWTSNTDHQSVRPTIKGKQCQNSELAREILGGIPAEAWVKVNAKENQGEMGPAQENEKVKRKVKSRRSCYKHRF